MTRIEDWSSIFIQMRAKPCCIYQSHWIVDPQASTIGGTFVKKNEVDLSASGKAKQWSIQVAQHRSQGCLDQWMGSWHAEKQSWAVFICHCQLHVNANVVAVVHSAPKVQSIHDAVSILPLFHHGPVASPLLSCLKLHLLLLLMASFPSPTTG